MTLDLPSANVLVIIASKGRPQALAQRLEILNYQTLRPAKVIYSVSDAADLPRVEDLFTPHTVVMGPAGSARQRNRGLAEGLQGIDVVIFFDDDFVPERRYIENAVRFLDRNPGVAGVNGRILQDGINGPGIDFETARASVEQASGTRPAEFRIVTDLVGLYGCNMVFRASAIGTVRFDEKLPLYSWQEDIDFAAQVGREGRIVLTDSFMGVHQGVKSARVSGKKFGYSQISNPVYLIRKGTMPLTFGLTMMVKNVISNHVKIIRPESWVDRKGRAVGNWIAIKDLLTNRIDPEKVLRF